MGKTVPDLVVWDADKDYYQQRLPYGSDLAAPSIKIENVSGWKQSQAISANHLFSTRFDEIKNEFIKLMDEVAWNDLVYSSEFNFIPIVGHTYHLYRKRENSYFLSLISPNEWEQEFIGSTKINSENKWIRIS